MTWARTLLWVLPCRLALLGGCAITEVHPDKGYRHVNRQRESNDPDTLVS